jgi:fatty-acyl-CoA synthase
MSLLNVTIADVLKENSKEYPHDIAYIFENISYTWKELDDVTDIMAIKLLNNNIKKDMHVGIWSINSIEQIFTIFAVIKTGAVATILNYSYKDLEIESLLYHSHAEYLLYGESTGSINYKEIIERNYTKLPKLKKYCSVNKLFAEAMDDYKNKKTIRDESLKRLEKAKKGIRSEDSAFILFTSGTTYMAKGVLLSHYNLINNAMVISERMSFTRNDSMLISMPIFHCSGLTCGILIGLMVSMPSVIMRKFNSEAAMKLIEKYKISVFNVVPSMLFLLVQDANFGKYDISSWKSGIVAGSGMTGEKYLEIISKLPETHLQIGYGQTETSPLITLSNYDDEIEIKSKSLGKVLPHIEIRIWDEKNKSVCRPYNKGEIQCKGFCCMIGYYNLPEVNKKKFTEDGWLKTDDCGYFDENGYLYFVDRINNLIIRNGENISPNEIECVIKKYSEEITEAIVVGVDVGSAFQEEIIAFVKTENNENIDSDKLKCFIGKKLANYKVPKFIFHIEEIPLNSIGKIDYRSIKRKAKEIIYNY